MAPVKPGPVGRRDILGTAARGRAACVRYVPGQLGPPMTEAGLCYPGYLGGTLPGRHDALSPPCGYGVNVPATSSQLHEWDIHIVSSGTGGARVTEVGYASVGWLSDG
jgi:hypothetical protein